MEIREVKDHNEWENFVLKQPYTIFVQSYHYGEFYRAQGEQYWILGIYEDSRLIGGSLIVSVHAKRGNFFYLPYGPILPEEGREDAFQQLVSSLAAFAKEEAVDFIRICPFLDETATEKTFWKEKKFRDAPMHMLAETTWLLQIQLDEEAMLMNMKKNHRNLVRRCEKEGVKVTIDATSEALEDFNTLHDYTAERQHFTRFSRRYISTEFSAFAAQGEAAIFRAYLSGGRLDSAAIIMYYGNMACYRHGASRSLDHKIPTSYLIQWRAIQEARKRGMMWYNFWGIAPADAPKNHPFKGITHFKTGFGGFQKNLLHCQDLALRPKYWLNWMIETFRRKKRGF